MSAGTCLCMTDTQSNVARLRSALDLLALASHSAFRPAMHSRKRCGSLALTRAGRSAGSQSLKMLILCSGSFRTCSRPDPRKGPIRRAALVHRPTPSWTCYSESIAAVSNALRTLFSAGS